MTPRQKAVSIVRAQLGLANIAPASWTYEQRTRYNQALAAYILENPGLFSKQDLDSAALVFGKAYSPLQDTSFDWSQFGDEFSANAAPVFAGFQLTLNKVLVGLGLVLALFLVAKSRPARAQ